jgi:hypothetical protein
MSPRTLWNIVLKVFGLYIFLQLLFLIPQLFTIASLLFTKSDYGADAPAEIAAIFFNTSVYLFMFIAFIFRTDWLINALRLNKGIAEEKLELNIHRSTVLQIATIIAGIVLLGVNLPILLKELFTYYQEMNMVEGFRRYSGGGWIIFHLVEVFISFFMITSSRLIVNFIERKRKGKVQIPGTEV